MKQIKLDTIPEQVNGMKTRLFARYINWFNKNISPRDFYFNFVLAERQNAIESCNVMSKRGNDQYDVMAKRLKKGHCDSVGCFTGWSIKCGFLITNLKERLENEKNNVGTFQGRMTTHIDSNEFGAIIGVSSKIASFLFMPDDIYPWQSRRTMGNKETVAWQDVGPVNVFFTKMEMLHRCVKFLDYVVDGTIDPNPTARMSEAEAEDKSGF